MLLPFLPLSVHNITLISDREHLSGLVEGAKRIWFHVVNILVSVAEGSFPLMLILYISKMPSFTGSVKMPLL